MKKLKVFESTNNTDSKFKVGEKVYYTPKLSGFNNNKPLIIRSVNTETQDFMGNKYETPIYVYSFEDSSLSAYENQLSKNTKMF